MGACRFTTAILATLLFAIILGAPRAQGYTNPIENQTNETINADAWNLGTTNLYVGNNTWGNTMIVTNGGQVGNAAAYIGQSGNAYSNKVTVTGAGSVWSNSSTLFVGHYGDGNELIIADGGRVESLSGYVATYSSPNATDNRVTVTGTGSVWKISSTLEMGSQGDNNELIISDGGRVENVVAMIGVHDNATGNHATVTGAGSVWSNSSALSVGNGHSGNFGNSISVTNGGTVFTPSLTVRTGNSFNLNRDGMLDIGGDFDASMTGFNWNSGGHLSVGGALSGMPADSGSVFLDGTDKRLTLEGGSWDTSAYLLYVTSCCTSNSTLLITSGGRVLSDQVHIGDSTDNVMVTVTGSGSVWSNSFIWIGNQNGDGNKLNITHGGWVESSGATIGTYDCNSNMVMVADSGSVWNCSGPLSLGVTGGSEGNSLYITDGGRVQTTSGHIGGDSTCHSNQVTVSGAGSVWSNSSTLFVGYSDEWYAKNSGNLLTVSSNGAVAAQSLTIISNNNVNLQSGGVLAMSGGITIHAGAALAIDIRGDDASERGRLMVGGLASLDGTLEVVLSDGFSPTNGASFDLFGWDGGKSGTFATVNLPALFGRKWNTNDLYVAGELSVAYSTADTNGNGITDGWEYQYFGGACDPSAMSYLNIRD